MPDTDGLPPGAVVLDVPDAPAGPAQVVITPAGPLAVIVAVSPADGGE